MGPNEGMVLRVFFITVCGMEFLRNGLVWGSWGFSLCDGIDDNSLVLGWCMGR